MLDSLQIISVDASWKVSVLAPTNTNRVPIPTASKAVLSASAEPTV